MKKKRFVYIVNDSKWSSKCDYKYNCFFCTHQILWSCLYINGAKISCELEIGAVHFGHEYKKKTSFSGEIFDFFFFAKKWVNSFLFLPSIQKWQHWIMLPRHLCNEQKNKSLKHEKLVRTFVFFFNSKLFL